MERDWTHAGIQEAAYAALAKGLAAYLYRLPG